MSTRYLGIEPAATAGQVVRYLTENYADANGKPMPEETAARIVESQVGKIKDGINVFRSNVCYLGDEALKNSGEQGWTELPEPDDDYDDDEDEE
jgi:hypothetical protein